MADEGTARESTAPAPAPRRAGGLSQAPERALDARLGEFVLA